MLSVVVLYDVMSRANELIIPSVIMLSVTIKYIIVSGSLLSVVMLNVDALSKNVAIP